MSFGTQPPVDQALEAMIHWLAVSLVSLVPLASMSASALQSVLRTRPANFWLRNPGTRSTRSRKSSASRSSTHANNIFYFSTLHFNVFHIILISSNLYIHIQLCSVTL